MAVTPDTKKSILTIRQLFDYLKFFASIVLVYILMSCWKSYDMVVIPVYNDQMSPTFTPKDIHIGYRYRDWSEIQYDHFVYYDYPIQPKKNDRRKSLFFGRVVGLPGDRISFKNGQCHRNGHPLDEKYVSKENQSYENYPEMIIPRDYVYLLVDNRKASLQELCSRDSRFWGPIFIHTIVGQILPK